LGAQKAGMPPSAARLKVGRHNRLKIGAPGDRRFFSGNPVLGGGVVLDPTPDPGFVKIYGGAVSCRERIRSRNGTVFCRLLLAPRERKGDLEYFFIHADTVREGMAISPVKLLLPVEAVIIEWHVQGEFSLNKRIHLGAKCR
jgi:hypothetical protein